MATKAKAKKKKKKKALAPGTKVSWNTPQGRTTGKVLKKQTRATKIKTHKVAASRFHPEYIVESAKTGKKAAHKRKSLKRI